MFFPLRKIERPAKLEKIYPEAKNGVLSECYVAQSELLLNLANEFVQNVASLCKNA